MHTGFCKCGHIRCSVFSKSKEIKFINNEINNCLLPLDAAMVERGGVSDDDLHGKVGSGRVFSGFGI